MANILSNTDGGMLTKDNRAVVFIDHQPQMTFGASNIDRQLLVNNVVRGWVVNFTDYHACVSHQFKH
jgi:hypothetical protein